MRVRELWQCAVRRCRMQSCKHMASLCGVMIGMNPAALHQTQGLTGRCMGMHSLWQAGRHRGRLFLLEA